MGHLDTVRHYLGIPIVPTRRTIAGMRYRAWVGDHFVYADTLAGIKRQIQRAR